MFDFQQVLHLEGGVAGAAGFPHAGPSPGLAHVDRPTDPPNMDPNDPLEQDEQHAQHLPKHAHTIIEPPDGAAAIGDNAPCEQEQSAETPDASIDKDNYIIFMENE